MSGEPTTPSEAQSVGSHLDRTPPLVRDLLGRARRLVEIERVIHAWAQAPLSNSLRVANVRDGVLVLLIENAAAYTAIRYRQQELLEVLRQRLGMTIRKVEMKTVPAVPSGAADRV